MMIKTLSNLRGLGSRTTGIAASLAVALLAAACGPTTGSSGSSSLGSGSGGGSGFLAGDSDVFHVTGPEGGPFPEGRREYWIKNTTKHSVLRWSVAATIPWLEFSEKGGLLAPGAQTTVLAQVDHTVAEALAPGDYPADIVFRDARTGGGEIYLAFLLTVTENGSGGSILTVTPAEPFVSSGDVGGPVYPPRKTYTLENTGDVALDWLAGTSQSWLGFVGATAGSLQPNERVDVVVAIDPSDPNLDAGQHLGLVDFENLTHGEGTTSREVHLTLSGSSEGRVTDGIQALYGFDEGTGTVVRDTSGVTPPLDLVVEDPANVSWGPGVLQFNAPTRAVSNGSAQRFKTAVQATGELTIEAWIDPKNLTQEGPARIVTISNGPYLRNFTLGQGLWGGQPSDSFNMRLRTTQSDLDGMPMLTTGAGAAKTGLQHVTFTRSASGQTRLYVNGQVQAEGQLGGDFGNWDAGYALALGNEIGASRPWLGSMHLVALFDRALTPAEVNQNFLAGAGDDDSGQLVVDPASAFTVTGTTNGDDFSASEMTYTLSNPGSEPIDWSTTCSEPWVYVTSSASGTLGPNSQTTLDIEVDVDTIKTFSPGAYKALLNFRNETNDFGTTSREVIALIKSEGGGGDGNPARPGPHNTGPYDDSNLTPMQGFTVTEDGAVIENVSVTGTIKVQANNVTIRNFRIDGSGSWYGVNVVSGSNCVIEDGEITNCTSAGVLGSFTARRLNIHDMGADGVKTGSNSLVEGCWIHHIGMNPESHADGNQTTHGTNIRFIGNFLDLPSHLLPEGPGPPYQSHSAFMNQAGAAGPIKDFLIKGNWINGGAYTVYVTAPDKGYQSNNDGCKLIDNIFGQDYYYGPITVVGNVTNFTVDGNYWDDGNGYPGDWMSINDQY